MTKPKDKFRVMKDLDLREISLVDQPMQEPARVAIMKRRDAVEKALAMTTMDAGHAHTIVTNAYQGGEVRSGTTSYDDGHSHSWIMDEAGNITVAAAAGHRHGINQITKREFSAEERQAAADSGAAMPDGSFPIKNEQDLKNAIRAFGRAKDKAAAAKHIKARARALGLTNLLPDAGQLAKGTDDGTPAAADGQLSAGEHAATGGAEIIMTPEQLAALQKAAEDQKAKIAELEKANQRSQSILKLNPQERAHFDTLTGEAADTFLAKSSTEREQVLKNLADSDPVVFKSLDGTEYRKSDDPRLVKTARERDEDRKELLAERAIRKQADLEKRATEQLPNLPGALTVKAAILGAVEGIADENVRKAALEVLKQQDAGLGKAFQRVGTGSAPNLGKSASDKLDDLAKKFAADNKCDMAKAYDAVCRTAEGAALYNEHLAEQRAGR